ncbi:ABC transporter ATP-binding protein [Devosia sp. YIM 151766]|uniref:oligopeptide/dipeptide ABC transporter ATP-binding protein n=1 Tax=Devosia sp. YIM 151766 TaxID=3017325 RepID=UPI00255C99FF|nr:ABC transporter ATP-binding protein [Devosia sp. YIM 151766]WIY52553.1 ABC transporter ATP-binding protein [Devosia sp. YIM 151766]
MADDVVSIEGASVLFNRRVHALDDVSLRLRQGDNVGVVGESGSGKTTLSRLVVGLTRPTAGRVRVLGQDLASSRIPRDFRKRAQFLMQDAVAALSPRMTVRALLTESAKIFSMDRAAFDTRLGLLLERLKLTPTLLDRYPHQLSGGQARRVGVARALLLEPELLVADEPTAGLDVSVQGEMLNLLQELRASLDLTFMMVSHNLHVVRRVTNRTVIMYLGQVVEDAPTRRLFSRPAHPYTAALFSANPMLSPDATAPPILLRGEIPSNVNLPKGCRFASRCPVAQPVCSERPPQLEPLDPEHSVRCHFPFSLTTPR